MCTFTFILKDWIIFLEFFLEKFSKLFNKVILPTDRHLNTNQSWYWSFWPFFHTINFFFCVPIFHCLKYTRWCTKLVRIQLWYRKADFQLLGTLIIGLCLLYVQLYWQVEYIDGCCFIIFFSMTKVSPTRLASSVYGEPQLLLQNGRGLCSGNLFNNEVGKPGGYKIIVIGAQQILSLLHLDHFLFFTSSDF